MKWHRRPGYASLQYLLELKKRDPEFKSIDFDNSITQCDICQIVKFTKLQYKESRSRAVKPLQIVHSDVMELLKPISYPTRNKYIVVFINDFSRFAMAYVMESKDETGFYFEKFIDSVRNLIGSDEKVCTLRSDMGTEYIGAILRNILRKIKYNMRQVHLILYNTME